MRTGSSPPRAPWRSLSCLLLVLSGVACDGLLEVDDPTRVEEEAARSGEFAEAWSRGSAKMVSEGWDGMLALLSIASDELRFEGPHAYWGPLDRGEIGSPGNDGLQQVFPLVAAGFGMAEETVELLDSLEQAGTLADPSTLARAHLVASIISATVADGLEDFAPSDGREPGPPLGAAGMSSLYDRAIEHATLGLSVAEGGELRRNLLAARARAAHGAQVRARIRPPPANVSGEGLVVAADAAADALAALALDGTDWQMAFDFPAFVVRSYTLRQLTCSIRNYRPGASYATATGPNPDQVTVTLLDPVDGVPDPSVARTLSTVLLVGETQCGAGSLPVLGAPEMRLIVAEHALAEADTTSFTEQVNLVRASEGLSPWSPTSGVTAREILIHERRARLYLTGRRLADMYRFGISSDAWDPSSVAATLPGTLYPIAQSEIDVNCYLNGSCG
jgi:hypothetical protein